MNKLLLIILILYVYLMHSKDKDYEDRKEDKMIQHAILEERRRLQAEVDELRRSMLQ